MPGKKWRSAQLRSESSYLRSCILITAAHLDLFRWIGTQKKTPRAVAARFGGSPAGWEIFLNALCGISLLRKRGAKFANTFFSLRHIARSGAAYLLPEYDAWGVWGGLASALLEGRRPKVQKPFLSDRKKAERLLHGLHQDAQKIAPQLIRKLPLRRASTLLDVGGGLGAFAIAFCGRYPLLRATLVEHPLVVTLARRAIRDAGMEKRVRVIGLDFCREPLPHGFDAVFVSNVLHGHGADENRALLVKIHDCLNPDGQLILRDVFMSHDGTAPEWGALFSVLLLLHTPEGRCYALKEIVGWMRHAGFSNIKGPLSSSSLAFDPDSILIAEK
jgi:SAM-dependent methyltransferase